MKKLTLILITLQVISINDSCGQSSEFIAGEPAPSFSLINQYGNNVSLSDFRGKLLILDFWASYCGPCRQQTELFFKPLYDKLNSTNFEILSISRDKDIDKWKHAIEVDDMSWPQVCLALNNNTVEQDYRIDYLPTVIIVDENGKFLGRDLSKIGLLEIVYNNLEPKPSIAIGELYDVTKNFKDWEDFLEDLVYELDKYVYENTVYPESAKNNGITGSIPVMLIIGDDFKIELLTFLKDVPGTNGKEKVQTLGHGCEEEVLRVIESMQNWKTFPYVQQENTYSTTIVFHFPPQEPVRQSIDINH